MAVDEITLRQSEAESNLQKYIVFQKKNEKLEKSLKDIRDKNEQILKATEDINKIIIQIEPHSASLDPSKLDVVSTHIHR